MDVQTLTLPRALPYSLLLLALLAPAAQGALGKPQEAQFRTSRTLPQDRDQILGMVTEVLEETVGVESVDRDDAVVTSRYYFHTNGPSRFRTRVTCVVTSRNEGTVVQVKAQRELLMEALSPGVYQAGPRWQDVGDHEAVSTDIVARIEKAAGVYVDPEEEALRNAAAEALAAAGGVPAPAGAPVPSQAWQEIESLKTERRDLLAPIRALDEEALNIVYREDLQNRQGELARIKEERNRLWERTRPRIMEIDKRILELVLSE